MSPLKRAVFALITLTIMFGVTLGVLLAADLYAHTRVERSAGLNRHGYRGPVVGKKRPGEVRAVMLGGSTVFGFNIEYEDALPEQLDRATGAPVSCKALTWSAAAFIGAAAARERALMRPTLDGRDPPGHRSR